MADCCRFDHEIRLRLLIYVKHIVGCGSTMHFLSSSEGNSVNDKSETLLELQRKFTNSKSSNASNKQDTGNNKGLEYKDDNDDNASDSHH